MAADVTMPRLSDSMEEGTILKWLVSEGDEVKRGQELVEIETDKANMTYEADSDGTLVEIVAEEGDTARRSPRTKSPRKRRPPKTTRPKRLTKLLRERATKPAPKRRRVPARTPRPRRTPATRIRRPPQPPRSGPPATTARATGA
jgi:pyruvate/2-oxoglutarate dehydrogenase complex dihydrolipoamide acyltransferase (E2) component